MKTANTIDILTANIVELDTLIAPINTKILNNIAPSPEEFEKFWKLHEIRSETEFELNKAWQSLVIKKQPFWKKLFHKN